MLYEGRYDDDRESAVSQSPPMPAEAPASSEFKNVVLSTLMGVVNPEGGGRSTAIDAPPVTLAMSGIYERRAPFYLDVEQATMSTRTALAYLFRALKQQHQSIRMVTLPDAQVTGQGAVMTRDNFLIKESVVEFTAHGRPPDGLMATKTGGYSLSTRVDFEVEAPCILVKRPWYANFGHWLVDGATVLALAAETVRARQLTVVVGNYASIKMRAIVLDTINQFAPNAKVLQHPDKEVWQFKELYYVTPPHVPPLFKSPEALRRVRAAFVSTIGAAEPHRKLFVSRSGAANRRVVNEAEVFEVCAARGFEFVQPEKLSLVEQAKIFAEATTIVGAKGAALTNCLFCAPGAKTMLLCPSDFPDPFFWDVCAQTGDYGELYGPIVTAKSPGLNEFTVEPARVSKMLDAAGV